jgi:hypothetical protein
VKRATRFVVTGAGFVASAGILLAIAKPAAPISPPSARPTVTVTAAACAYGPHGEADRRCTPGATSTLVTQANLGQTICAPPPPPGQKSFIARQRPDSHITSRIRDGQLLRYYYGPDQHPTAVQVREDHLISLEIGGAPVDPANLYPQLVADSLAKDREENELHARVCAGTLLLASAQRLIVEHWTR